MHLNTYKSRTIPDVFVTLPSTEARFVIAMIDELSALRLQLFRADYTISAEADDLHFLELVTTRIADDGYAIHGFDVAVARGAPEGTPDDISSSTRHRRALPHCKFRKL